MEALSEYEWSTLVTEPKSFSPTSSELPSVKIKNPKTAARIIIKLTRIILAFFLIISSKNF